MYVWCYLQLCIYLSKWIIPWKKERMKERKKAQEGYESNREKENMKERISKQENVEENRKRIFPLRSTIE